MARVAVLGTGLMGSAAAERLASQGFEVIVWNRTREKAEALARMLGASLASSVEEALGSAEYSVAFLADDEALMSVAARVGRVDGLVFINSSTVTPQAALRTAEFLEGRGACYVEAPVLGGPRAVREGRVVVIEAGKSHCKRMALHVLSSLAERIVDAGDDPAKAQALKLAFNQLLIGSLAILSEALSTIEGYGVDPGMLREVYKGTVFEGLVEKYLDRLLSDEWPTSFRLALAAKDLDYARRAAWAAGLAAPVTSAAAELYKLASHAGYADSDYSRIYKFLRGGTGRD